MAKTSAFLLLIVAACDGDESSSPIDKIPVDEEIAVEGLTAPAHLVRDEYGIPHIYASNSGDAAFVNGFAMAQDRMPQMELGRRQAAGRLSEFAGSLVGPDEQADLIRGDLEMRMHRFYEFATDSLALLEDSNDPIDVEVAQSLQQYAAGVSAQIARLQDGTDHVPDIVNRFIDPERLEPWTATDSLVFGYLMAFVLSYDESALHMTDWIDKVRLAFDAADGKTAPDWAARAGAAADLFRVGPARAAFTADEFPNVDEDTGSRAGQRRHGSGANGAAGTKTRPHLSPAVLAGARQFFGADRASPGFGEIGSNSWIVDGEKTENGNPLLANDTHLALDNPATWYVIHVDLTDSTTNQGDDGPNVAGVAFPGIPGVILGHNEHVAWGATVVAHDVTDYYAETIQPCSAGAGDCVFFDGNQVPIEEREEVIRLGALGTILEERSFPLEFVPHHGPIVPIWEEGELVPRAGNEAVSVRFTGHAPSKQIRAFWRADRAHNAEEAADAFCDFEVGGQNWVIIDHQSIRWTTHALIPILPAECKTFHAVDNPDGLAPYLVLPGTGECEWQGFLDARYIPHAINPAEGFLVTANADPVGASADNNLLNGPPVDGNPLYLGYAYDLGFRTGRIQDRLQGLIDDGGVSFDEMAQLQADKLSPLGNRMRDFIIDAVRDSTSSDARMMEAADRLEAWSLQTPPAVEGEPTADEIADSAASSIFNAWVSFFVPAVLLDELTAAGIEGADGLESESESESESEGEPVDDEEVDPNQHEVDDQILVRSVLALLEQPEQAVSGINITTGDPTLFDDLSTVPALESRDDIVLASLAAALDWLASDAAFSTDDMDAWRWGALHRLTLTSIIPDDQLNNPGPDAPAELAGGFPRGGENFTVDVANGGVQDQDFQYHHGPAIRTVVEMTPDGPRSQTVIPGGQAYDPDSPHFGDQMELWRHNQAIPIRFTEEEVAAGAEHHILFVPAN